MKILILMLFAAICPGCQSKGLEVPDCSPDYSPIEVVSPISPGRMEDQSRGTISAVLLIESDGTVSNAEVSSIDLQQLGRGRAELDEYEEAVLKAVLLWRFPRTKESCMKEVTIRLSLSKQDWRESRNNGVRDTSQLILDAGR